MLDADDEFFPQHLERMLPLAAQHGLAITQVEYVDHGSGQRLPNRAKPSMDGLLALEDILLTCLHTYNPVMFDSHKIRHGWQERVRQLVDAVFLAECFNVLPSVWYAAEPSYRYFRHGDSVCNAPGAAQRFLEAGRIIRALVENGGIPANPHVARVLRAFIARNDKMEMAFEKACGRGEVSGYQDFIGRTLALLHAPLL